MNKSETDIKDLQIQSYLQSTLKFKPMTKHARCGRYGKFIKCSDCDHISRVYHFGWSALGCIHCGKMVDKYSYLTEVK